MIGMLVNALIAGGILALSWYFKIPALDVLNTADAKNVIGVVVQISAVMIGFIITALSVLATITHQPLLKNMQESGHFAFLLRRLLVTTLLFSVSMIIGMYILLTAHPGQLSLWLLYASLIFATVFLADAGRLLWIVLTNLHPTT